jgi:hypothetical protein
MEKNIDPRAKVNMRVKLIKMVDDPRPVDSELEGTIDYIDSLGTLHVQWDDGRRLGLIPGVDEYYLYPPKDQQITDLDSVFNESSASVINRSMPKPTLRGAKSTKAGKNFTKNAKSAFSKARVRDIKVEDEIKGGKADKLTPSEIAKKHGVSLKDIQKEIEIGIKIEMEHTDDSVLAREITLDHLVEFPDYYSNKKYGLKASEKNLEKEKEDVEETTMAAGGVSTGAFVGPLTKKESRIIKVSDLLQEYTDTKLTKLRDAGSGYDGNAWVGEKGDGWLMDQEPAWPDGEIVDILSKLDINWNDSNLSITTNESLQKAINNLIQEVADKDIHTAKWKRCVKKVKKNSPDVDPYAVCTDSIGYEGSIKKAHRRKDESEELDETTTFSSVWGSNGPPVTPAFAAKDGQWRTSKNPIFKGGKIVQKLKNDGVLTEENKIKWVSGGKFVKIKDKCAKYNNQEWCDAGNASDPLELSDTTFKNVSEVSKKLGIPESIIIERIKAKLGK